MKDSLIFFSERYPNEFIGGVYEEKEIKELHSYFERVLATNTVTSDDNDTNFFIPENLASKTFKPKNRLIDKFFAIRLIFTKIFLDEFLFIKRNLKVKINAQVLIVMLIELSKAIEFKKFIEKQIKKQQINLDETIIYSFWNDYRALAAALLKKDMPKIKAISRAHGGDVYYERHPNNYLPYKNFIFNTLDGIFPISNCSVEYLSQKLNYNKNNLKAFKLGVSNHFSLNKYAKQETLHIASCSHIVSIKRVDLIAKGLNKINTFSFVWSHIGADYSNNIVKDFCEKNMAPSTQKVLLHNYMSNKSIMDYYHSNQIDLFINASVSEGIPVSIMEAMSFGIPVLATNVGGNSEIVKDGFNGFLLTPNPSPKEIKETINKFNNLSHEQRLTMRKNAYDTWNNDYNAEKNYQKFVNKVLSL